MTKNAAADQSFSSERGHINTFQTQHLRGEASEALFRDCGVLEVHIELLQVRTQTAEFVEEMICERSVCIDA